MGVFNRDGVKRRLVEVVAAALGSEWDVTYEWGDGSSDRFVYFDPPEPGNLSYESTGASPTSVLQTTDTFTIQALIGTYGHITCEDAERAAGDAMRTVDTTFRSLRNLRDQSGVIPDGETDDYRGISTVGITTVRGPAADKPQTDEDTIGGMCLITFTCVSRN